MVTLAYIAFVVAIAILGGVFGIVAHYWRAHATMYAEDLGLGEPLNTLTRDDYQFEKHVVGAEWDDAGYWASDSVRNLLYYVASGFMVPVIAGLALWTERESTVAAICSTLSGIGLKAPVCF